MILNIIKSGTVGPVSVLIRCNLKHTLLPLKYSCQKDNPESEDLDIINFQFTGNWGREEQIKWYLKESEINPEYGTL